MLRSFSTAPVITSPPRSLSPTTSPSSQQRHPRSLAALCARTQSHGNVWQYLRGNKLAITVFKDYDDIVDKSCQAWSFFANDCERVASVTTRPWATVNL
jgi:hypothetical protein